MSERLSCEDAVFNRLNFWEDYFHQDDPNYKGQQIEKTALEHIAKCNSAECIAIRAFEMEVARLGILPDKSINPTMKFKLADLESQILHGNFS